MSLTRALLALSPMPGPIGVRLAAALQRVNAGGGGVVVLRAQDNGGKDLRTAAVNPLTTDGTFFYDDTGATLLNVDDDVSAGDPVGAPFLDMSGGRLGTETVVGLPFDGRLGGFANGATTAYVLADVIPTGAVSSGTVAIRGARFSGLSGNKNGMLVRNTSGGWIIFTSSTVMQVQLRDSGDSIIDTATLGGLNTTDVYDIVVAWAGSAWVAYFYDGTTFTPSTSKILDTSAINTTYVLANTASKTGPYDSPDGYTLQVWDSELTAAEAEALVTGIGTQPASPVREFFGARTGVNKEGDATLLIYETGTGADVTAEPT